MIRETQLQPTSGIFIHSRVSVHAQGWRLDGRHQGQIRVWIRNPPEATRNVKIDGGIELSSIQKSSGPRWLDKRVARYGTGTK
jgi:hypothetical protein